MDNYYGPLKQQTQHDKVHLLHRLGYIQEEFDTLTKVYANDLVYTDAIASYQEFHGLDVTGYWNEETERLLHQRICPLPDIDRNNPPTNDPVLLAELWPMSIVRQINLSNVSSLSRWGIKDVTFWTDAQFKGVPLAIHQEVYREAAYMWNNLCGINLTWKPSKSGTNLYQHGGRIDGKGGTLAWQYLPGRGQTSGSLEGKIDNAEAWAGKERTFLRPTDCHELGHAIGLPHVKQQAAIMYPSMNGTQVPHNIYDGAPARERYGDPNGTTPPPEEVRYIGYMRYENGKVYLLDNSGNETLQVKGRLI